MGPTQFFYVIGLVRLCWSKPGLLPGHDGSVTVYHKVMLGESESVSL